MTEWDPDGLGPRGPVTVVGGTFTAGGDVVTNGLAFLDTETGEWSPLATNRAFLPGALIQALAAMPNGDLVVGGDFEMTGTGPIRDFARWDGSNWSSVSNSASDISDLVVAPDGSLYAAGNFQTDNSGQRVARFEGPHWKSLGSGLPNTTDAVVTSLEVLPNGDLIAGGYFTSIGGIAAANIARWNGTAWHALGAGLPVQTLSCVALPDGSLVASGGGWVGATYTTSIMRWNGSSWADIRAGRNTFLGWSLGVGSDGRAIMGGQPSLVPGGEVLRLDGAMWTTLGTSDDVVRVVHQTATGTLLAGGSFLSFGAAPTLGIAKLNWSGWSPVSVGTNAPIRAYAAETNGGFIAAGEFTTIGEVGLPANRIARWNGSNWSSLGSGTNAAVLAVAETPEGGVVAGGVFTSAGGVAANRIALWDGVAWSGLGAGLNGTVFAVAVLPNGEIVAGGQFAVSGAAAVTNIARWSEGAWQPLGTGVNGGVNALTVLPDGGLLVGGDFTTAGGASAGRLALWREGTWSTFGTGLNGSVRAISHGCNGELFAAGNFSTAGGVSAHRIARWDGAAWRAMGVGLNNTVNGLTVLPDGGVVAAGLFTMAGGQPAAGIALWERGGWSPLATVASSPGAFYAVAATPLGDVVAGGKFASVQGVISAFAGTYHFGSSADFNRDGDTGTDADIVAFFACMSGARCATCRTSDFNADGDAGTDADIESFFRVLAGGSC